MEAEGVRSLQSRKSFCSSWLSTLTAFAAFRQALYPSQLTFIEHNSNLTCTRGESAPHQLPTAYPDPGPRGPLTPWSPFSRFPKHKAAMARPLYLVLFFSLSELALLSVAPVQSAHLARTRTYGDNATPYEGEFLSIRGPAPRTLTVLSNSTSYDRRSISGHDFKSTLGEDC